MVSFAHVPTARQSCKPRCHIARHRHDRPYAALILQGGYEECGSHGRFTARAGQVLLHRRFDAHLNRFDARGARLLNLLLPEEPRAPFGCVADVDAIARLAEGDAAAASAALLAKLRPLQPQLGDWPDVLAQDLLADPQLRLADWARTQGLAAASLSRGFRQVFAITAAAFRCEIRTQRALALMAPGGDALASIAAQAGFADQAHMTRAIGALTGKPPGYWRRSIYCKTATLACGIQDA